MLETRLAEQLTPTVFRQLIGIETYLNTFINLISVAFCRNVSNLIFRNFFCRHCFMRISNACILHIP